jgi:YD repeat-containing protein
MLAQRAKPLLDQGNRPTKTIFTDGTFKPTGYDVVGRKISETDQAGHATTFQYDDCGRLERVTDAMGGTTSHQYDEVGNVIARTDARGNTVEITIKGVNASGGVGAAAARKISFADEDLLGGLYYWAASSGAINRYDFGMRGQQAEPFYTTAMSGAICVGCHALSRDGSRIAVGLNTPGPATLRMLDVATRQQLFQQGSMFGGLGGSGGSNFEALTPDGAKVLTSEGGNLVLRDANSGTPLNATVQGGTMPDFSTDGTTVVFARENGANCPLGLCGLNPGVEAASLYIVPFNGTSFGTPSQLTRMEGVIAPSLSVESRSGLATKLWVQPEWEIAKVDKREKARQHP